jgi:hypothetical protein
MHDDIRVDENPPVRRRAPLRTFPDVGAVRTSDLRDPTYEQACAKVERPKPSVAGIVETVFQNLDDARDWESYNNLRDTYMGFPPDPRAFKGHPDLPPDENWRLMSSLRMAWLRASAASRTPKERKAARDAEIIAAIEEHPDLSARRLSVLLYGHERKHDTVNRIRQRLKEEAQMELAVANALLDGQSRIELRQRMDGEKLDAILERLDAERVANPLEDYRDYLEDDDREDSSVS